MWFWLLAPLAAAGNIYVEATNPILVKVDSQLVQQEPATRVIIPDLPEGSFRIEVANLMQKTVASTTVYVGERDSVNLLYEDRQIYEVEDAVSEVYGTTDWPPPIPQYNLVKLNRKLVKGKLKKKLKYVDTLTEGYSMTMREVDDMLNGFHLGKDRLVALTVIIDRIREPQNYMAIREHFPVDADRQAMEQLFEAVLAEIGEE